MNLNELSPRKTTFFMYGTDRTGESTKIFFDLRPFVLADEIWIERNFGSPEEVQKIFVDMDSKKILKILFKQMTKESKERLMAIKILEEDDYGNEVKVELKGYEILSHLVRDSVCMTRLFSALMNCRGLSREIIADLVGEKKKKKGTFLNKEQLIGLMSLT